MNKNSERYVSPPTVDSDSPQQSPCDSVAAARGLQSGASGHEHLLICDLNVSEGGHYRTFDQYIIDHLPALQESGAVGQVSFVFNEEARELLSFSDALRGHVHFIESAEAAPRNGLQRYRVLRRLQRLAKDLGAEHLLMMELDKYQAAICCQRFDVRVSGILFRPHHRIAVNGGGFRVWSFGALTRRKKWLSERLLISNPAIRSVFILSDYSGADMLNRRHGTDRFKGLPDPVHRYPADPSLRLSEAFAPDSYKFLVFGWLDERKNLTSILRAYDRAEFGTRTELLLVGPARADYLSYLNDLMAALTGIDGAHKRVHLRAEFVSDQEMDAYFSLSDACLLIYRDFFGSSGLLGRAVLHDTLVIGASTGLIKQLIDDYRLGPTCNPYSIDGIAATLASAPRRRCDAARRETFLEQHSPERFLHRLVQP